MFKLFNKNVYFADSYLTNENYNFTPIVNSSSKYFKSFLPKFFIKYFKIGLYTDGGFFWLHCYTNIDNILNHTIPDYLVIKKNDYIIILDEIFIINANLLDLERLSKKYKLYLKTKSRSYNITIEKNLKKFLEIDTFSNLPIELFRDYSYIIGNHSAALKMNKSISLIKILKTEYIDDMNPIMPNSLDELYKILNC